MSSKHKEITSHYTAQVTSNTSIQDGPNGSAEEGQKVRAEEGSSSTETLSAEERHTLKHTQRQEPQGEEQVYAHSMSSMNVPSSSIISAATTHLSRAPDSSTSSSSISVSRNNDSNLSMSSNTNTLIIHHSVPDESWGNRWLSGYTPSTPKSLRERSLQPTGTEPSTFVTRVGSKISETLTSSSSFTGASQLLSSSLLDSSGLGSSGLGSKNSLYLSNRMTSPTLPRTNPGKYCATNSTEILDIPSSYLDQSEVLKHLIHKEVKDPPKVFAMKGIHIGGSYGGNRSGGCSDQSTSSSISTINVSHADRGSVSGSSSEGSQRISAFDGDDADVSALIHRLHPPPAYPSWHLDCSVDLKESGAEGRTDKALLSKSQPDLTRVGTLKESVVPKEILSSRVLNILQDEDTPPTLKELVDILAHENSSLKLEVDICHRKVMKLQRFELEMAKVEEQYEGLVKLCERREQLERLARHKLHTEVRRLTELNHELKEQLEMANSTQAIAAAASAIDGNSELSLMKKELNRRDVFIAQLVSQNKELIAAKERQEMELTAQRQTLNEQRTHIDILDSALTNAQTNVVKLEEEVRKKQNLVEQAGQLKRLLLSIKMAADRREQSEKNLRQKLEMEILQLRSNAKMDQSSSDTSELRREIREREEKIMHLEGEVTKWEQRFLQESAIRQMAIEAASMPKDAKIAALEKNSHDSERRIAQAKSDKLRHLDEVQSMNKKITVLENRNRVLESYNAEREAMIRALQKRVEEKESTSVPSGQNSAGSNKSEGRANQQSGVQSPSRHQHSASIGGALPLSGTSALAPPRKDEELGTRLFQTHYLSQYPPISSCQSVVTPNRFKSQPDTHLRSESYCCYVNSSDHTDMDSGLPEYGVSPSLSSKQDPWASKDDLEKKQPVSQLRSPDMGQGQLRTNQIPTKPTSGVPSNPNPNLLSSTTGQTLSGLSKSPSPSPVYANVVEIQTSRGAPPPYFSHHQVLKTNPQEPTASPPPQPPPALYTQPIPPPQNPQGGQLQQNSLPVSYQPSAPPLQSQPPSQQPHPQPASQSQAQQQTSQLQSQVQQQPHSPPPLPQQQQPLPQQQQPLSQQQQQPLPQQQQQSLPQQQQPLPQQQQSLPQQQQPLPQQQQPLPQQQQPLPQQQQPLPQQQQPLPQQQQPLPQQQQPLPPPRSPPLPRPVAVCQRPHPPNALCRTCLSVRRSHRQNAAAFVRRANSSGCQHNRRSAPSPASSGDSLDDAPSILERLKKEWEMGFLGTPTHKREGAQQKPDGSKTLPQPLGLSVPTLSAQRVEGDKGSDEPQTNKTSPAQNAPKGDLMEGEASNEDAETSGKKDVAHLDRALNRLSIKRSSNPKLLTKRSPTEPPSTSILSPLDSSGRQSCPQDLMNPDPGRNLSNVYLGQSQNVCDLNVRNQMTNAQLHQHQYFPSNQLHQHTQTQHNQFQHYQQQQQSQQNQKDLDFIRDIRKEPIELMILEDSDHLKQNFSGVQLSYENHLPS